MSRLVPARPLFHQILLLDIHDGLSEIQKGCSNRNDACGHDKRQMSRKEALERNLQCAFEAYRWRNPGRIT